jgi:hypothetical protein
MADRTTISVAGVPAEVAVDGNGFYVDVLFQNVTIDGSPLIVHLNPPVATIEQVSAPALLGLVTGLLNGAIIG